LTSHLTVEEENTLKRGNGRGIFKPGLVLTAAKGSKRYSSKSARSRERAERVRITECKLGVGFLKKETEPAAGGKRPPCRGMLKTCGLPASSLFKRARKRSVENLSTRGEKEVSPDEKTRVLGLGKLHFTHQQQRRGRQGRPDQETITDTR